jgi:hypothetical protein
MRRIVGYLNGKAQWSENVPASGNVSQRISGCAVIGVSAAEQERRAQRAYKAREAELLREALERVTHG